MSQAIDSTSSKAGDALQPAGRSPLMELLAIAIPTVATMTSYTLMTFVDKLMVSRIGPDPVYVGAQGNGGITSWIAVSIVFGTLTVVNTYVSQNFGAGKPERAPAYAWNGVWLSIIAWIVLILPYAAFIPTMFDLIRDRSLSPDALADAVRRDEMAAPCAQILLVGSIITMARQAIGQFFYGMHKPSIMLIAGVAGNISNFILNSVFIYGPNGPAEGTQSGVVQSIIHGWFAAASGVADALHIPALGVVGAAVGTVLGTVVELLVLLVVFLSPQFHRRFATRSGWRPSLSHLKDLFRIGWAPGLMFGNEMICWGAFMVYFVGHFGAQHSTAGFIAHQWMSLSFMPAVGISVAVTAVVGKCMGMGRPDLAAQRAWLALGLAMIYMGICAVCFIVFRHWLVGIFIDPETSPEVAAEVLRLGSAFLILCALFQIFDAIAMTLSGALRGAGDTTFVGVVTVISSWIVIVGGGWVSVRYFAQFESIGPWVAAALYIITLSIFILTRFLAGRWKSIRLVHDEQHPAPEPQVTAGAVADGVV
ncbi:MAG: MATE family efflux transporter [Phycisphaeraceae bacterium]|nr:MATE family efflux transporter [Phycisphaeraceae bacterium]